MDLTERLRASITQARAIDRSELLAEAADAIERLNKEVSILIAECQAMVDRCVNGPCGGPMPAGGPLYSDASAYTSGIPASGESKPTLTGTDVAENATTALTDAERASVTRAIETLEGVEYIDAFSAENDATAAATLRGLLERMG